MPKRTATLPPRVDPDDLPNLVTRPLFKEIFQISDPTFTRWSRDGVMEVRRIRGRVYVPGDEVRRLLAEGAA